tara:strand:- start:210 stop:908 length:699 start_codon:yes stop_codon:yes gene_type:complete
MKLLFENWRKYLNEGIDHRIQKQLDMLMALPDLAIRVEKRNEWSGLHAEGARVYYVRLEEGGLETLTTPGDEGEDTNIPETVYPKGYVEIFRNKSPRDIGECLGGWSVYASEAKQGWGPLLYEVALEWSSQNGNGLTSDRNIVSSYAEAVWDKYAARSDVDANQMDILHPDWDPFPDYPQLTPDDPSDDCDQDVAVDKKEDKWMESPLSRMYFKGTSEVMTALQEAGRLIEK